MARLVFACHLPLFLLLLAFQNINCKDTNLCAPSSCGSQTISNPFRLDSDPLHCGNPLYTLHCEKNTSTVLYLDSRKYYVQAINYNNLTIRVVDAGVKKNDCSSLPDFSLTYARLGNSRSAYGMFTYTNTSLDHISYPYTWFQYKKTERKCIPKYKPLPLSQMMTFINCANPVNSPLYVDTGTCLNGAKYSNVSLSTHSYVIVGGMKALDLIELCSLERTTLLPVKDYKNMSFKEIHIQLEYGFELSWHNSRCGSCATICYIDDSYHTKCAASFGMNSQFQVAFHNSSNLCAPSSCGNQTISNPFSLDSDPLNCGNPLYTLHCEKNTSTVLYLDSRKYYVQAINYDNLTIRVVDAGVQKNDCSSLPDFSLTYARLGNSRSAYGMFSFKSTSRLDYVSYPYTWFQYKKTGLEWLPKYKPRALSQMMVFINCANPVNSPLYLDTGACLNGGKYSNVSLSIYTYVIVGGMKASDLMEKCSLERMTLLPVKDYKNMSFKEIQRFELSWHSSRCGRCADGCYIEDSNRAHCIEIILIFVSPQTSHTVLVQGAKFTIGSPFVIAFLIYKWRRRHLSAYDTIEEFLKTRKNLVPVVRYSYSEINKMTGGFKEKIG
ncbi:hypothetical protein SADUNF_Sadunf07G0107900 [Salix dunnii]|uniref:Wall-associated receptor kinase galacturonan-binding domain-containing protein n=1 Tax=Salix dunnii TaxID=1413687 RepID=A0A835MW82_9ROSI|nr:hypothetical protein SADUNF_Sadunf07G0107900 [Salix dunnii]